MKRFFANHLIIVILVVLAAFAGCRKEKPETPEANGTIEVNLRADINKSTLKVANNEWEANDKVGLYMKPAGQPLSAAYSNVRNVQMSLDGQMLVADNRQINYPENSNVDFIAYYPYSASVGSDFTIDVNVAGQASGLPTEVLRSENVKNQEKTTSPVSLNFLYSLAKLEITVKEGENSPLTATDFSAMTATIEGMFTQANLQLADGTFANRTSKETITLHKKGNTDTSATFEALVLPTTEADGEITFAFHVNGITYRYEKTTNYETHSLYKLNFAILTSFPEPMATLLNTDIIPRNEKPTQDFFMDVTPKIIMTKYSYTTSLYYIGIRGTGKMIIDWGDGTPYEEYILPSEAIYDHYDYEKRYSDGFPYTITIYGENITHLYLGGSRIFLSSLDVSKNTALTYLDCNAGYLTSLDVNKHFFLKTA